MSGNFTQSRDRSTHPSITTGYVNSAGVISGASEIASWIPDYQTTTSFRSGVQADRLERESEQLDGQVLFPARYAASSRLDTGHEFSSVHTRMIALSHPVADLRKKNVGPGLDAFFRGPVVLRDWRPLGNQYLPVPPALTSSEIGYWGARMIRAASPTRPEAGLAVALAELKREGLPSLPLLQSLRSRAHLAKKAGSEYLNVEFGWKPLLRDIQSVARAVSRSSQILEQYRRDSGRFVRRRVAVPPEKRVESDSRYLSYDWNQGGSLNNILQSHGPTRIQDEYSTSIWFSGSFTYFLDMGDELMDKVQRYEQEAAKLLGTRVTPDVLWELAPWSWFVDWFASVGLSLSTASMFLSDGLVMQYGYLMRRTTLTRTVSVDATLYSGSQLTFTNTILSERKERVKATPFGFGLNPNSFSVRQWAILGALGLTRAPNIL